MGEAGVDIDRIVSVVLDAWVEELGHGDFGLEDNFFAVGGHSIRGVRVMKKVADSLGTRLPPRLLFKNPTVTELAGSIALHLRATPHGSA
jgi:hypothetical protein